MADVKSSAKQSRSCGECTLCCKLIAIAELGKTRGQWCQHCVKGKGCGIYESRPDECRAFNCGWLTTPSVGDEWKPIRSKMIFFHVLDGDTSKLIFQVDPGSPLAWRNEPYYSQLKRMAVNGLAHNGLILVVVGKHVIAVLPEREIDLGICEPDDKVSYRKNWNGGRWEIDVYKEPHGALTE